VTTLEVMISRSCMRQRYPGQYDPASMPPSQQNGPIAVYGASGYTGQLIAGELARREADFVLAGRNLSKLEAVAAGCGGPPVRAAALDDPGALRELLAPCAAVIACAGPFALHGEPVVRAAVETATAYLDTTGEQPFMRSVFDVHGPAAEEAGVPLVTAMGFDYMPGDMIAALTAAGMGPLDDISFAYSVRSFGPSRGTASSALGQIAGGDVEWRDGHLVPGDASVRRASHRFPPPVGLQRMTRYPAGEHITVPRHVDTANVHTTLTAATSAGHPRLAPLAAVTMPVIQRLVRTRARGAFDRAIARLPEGPSPENRARSRFTIDCQARGGGKARRGLIEGRDVYGLTAASTVEAALQLASDGGRVSGALAPSQAFDPAGFLAAMEPHGLRYEVAEL
jgi:short subunit dehydrogenase-like uncharacterized protein